MPVMEEMVERSDRDKELRRSSLPPPEVGEAEALEECSRLFRRITTASDKLVAAVNSTKGLLKEIEQLARPSRKSGLLGRRRIKRLREAIQKLNLQVSGAYMLDVYSALTGKEPSRA